MNLALSLGRSSFAIAFGVLIGAGAAVIGIEVAHPGDDRRVDHESSEGARGSTPPSPDPLSILDVSRGALALTGGVDNLAAMLRIGDGQPLVSINGQIVDAADAVDDLAVAWDQAQPGDYLDLQILRAGSPAQARVDHVLVLVHP